MYGGTPSWPSKIYIILRVYTLPIITIIYNFLWEPSLLLQSHMFSAKTNTLVRDLLVQNFNILAIIVPHVHDNIFHFVPCPMFHIHLLSNTLVALTSGLPGKNCSIISFKFVWAELCVLFQFYLCTIPITPGKECILIRELHLHAAYQYVQYI